MSVGEALTGQVFSIEGVRLAAASASIKKQGRKDTVLLELSEGTTTAGVFTRNAFCAAPVVICRDHLSRENPRYFIINSGNANAAVGIKGVDDALEVCSYVGATVGVGVSQVLPFSTGVIGERLPVHKITSVCEQLHDGLNSEGWKSAAEGIMTTDTRPKVASIEVEVNNSPVKITGMCKGSGMIRPDMATLLVFLATDAVISKDLLNQLLRGAVNQSFNRISVDSDTSTNDSCVLSATGKSGVVVNEGSESYRQFSTALNSLCLKLAQEIVRDGEGATKFVEVQVEGGLDSRECLLIAYSIADSPLVKTAIFASDANWGRIIMAIGKAGVVDLDVELVDVFLGSVCLVRAGQKDAGYREELGAAEMAKEEILIRVSLARGSASESVWTCDLSHDYVTINAEYRT